jgi:hypothetical protein
MANITVQNSAAADVVFVAKAPAAGDSSPAKWTADAASAIAGHRPSLSVATRDNGNKNARVLSAIYRGPVIVDGVQVAIVPGSASITLPTNVAAADVADHYVQFAHLLSSALLKAAAETGYAPS